VAQSAQTAQPPAQQQRQGSKSAGKPAKRMEVTGPDGKPIDTSATPPGATAENPHGNDDVPDFGSGEPPEPGSGG
jgi:hypothetical protein